MSDLEARVAELEATIVQMRSALAQPRTLLAVSANAPVRCILCMAAEAWGLATADLLSARRTRDLIEPRWATVWVARQTLPHSLPMIGRALNRDHTTIMSSLRRADRLRQRDWRFRRITDAMVAAFERQQAADLAAFMATPELDLVGEAA